MIPLNQNLSGLRRSAIRVYTNLAAATPGCIKLTLGEPDMETPANIRAAAAAALEAGQTHYAPNQGIPELRRSVAEYETRRGNAVTEDQVLVTIGATQALNIALTGILNPGDEVIIPTPAFSLYDSIVKAAGGSSVFLDLTKTGFQIEERALKKVLTPRTRAIVLNSPNNPTGVVLNRDSLSAVSAALREAPDCWLICDNVYGALAYTEVPDLSLEPALRNRVLLCQSFSKPYAMTGWRVGYLVAPEETLERLLLLSAAQIAAVPTFVQAAAQKALEVDTEPMRQIYAKRRSYVLSRLEGMGLSFPTPEGAFYVFPDISKYGIPSWEFCTRMIREGRLAAVPGVCFGAEGYIRLSYCYGDEELKAGLDNMEDFLGKL